MLRKLVIVSAFVGTCAAVPIIWQSNPEAIQSLVRSAVTEEPKPASETLALADISSRQMLAPSGRKAVINADPQGHFRSEFKVNGQRIQALIDTGATAVAMNISTARRAGIQVTPADLTRTVNTANGTARATAVMIARIEIGRISVENVPALILDDTGLDATLVGMTFLSKLKSYAVTNGALQLVQ